MSDRNRQLSDSHGDSELVEQIRSLPMELAIPLEIQRAKDTTILFPQDTTLSVPYEHLSTHMALLGTTGSGKSRMVQGICQHFISTMHGFTFIDPHGDTAEALLDYCVRQAIRSGDDEIIPRLHYLQPSEHQMFSFDPLRISRDWDERADATFAERNRIRTRAKGLVDVLLRRFSGVDKDVMRRLGRWLENAMVVLATPLPSGERLAFSDILVMLQPTHADYPRIIKQLRSKLPAAILEDLDYLTSLPRRRDQDFYLESSMNNVRAFADDTTEAIFGNHATPIDFEKVLKQREILIVNLRPSPSLPESTARSIADFLIHSLSSAAAGLTKKERTSHTLFIDEASQFVAEDLGQYLDQARKWKLSVALIGQQLSSFQRGDVDIGENVVNHCKLFASFQQKGLDDVEKLGKFFALPNLLLEEGDQRHQVPDASRDRIVTLLDRSRGNSTTQSKAKGFADAISRADTVAEGHSTTHGDTQSSGMGIGQFEGIGQSANFVNMDGQLVSLPTSSSNTGMSNFQSDSVGSMDAESNSSSKAVSLAKSHADIITKGTAESKMESMTIKQSLVAGTKSIFDPTGQPRYALPYQYAMSEHLLTTLPDRCCLLRGRIDDVEQTILIRSPDVPDPLPDTPEADEQRRQFLERLFASKDYLFRPTDVDQAAKDRRSKFLAAASKDTPKLPTDSREQHPRQDLPDGF